MVSTDVGSLVSGIRLSSVVPAEVSGDNKVHELSNMDLAMKLHYIRGVYFFNSEAVQGLTAYDLKKPMFPWLALYYTTSGRIRRHETSGRPFIKCNDSGVRIVEAYCDKTIDEWFAARNSFSDNCLVYDHVLGPDLGFSPLAFIQFTWFKCGGISVGLSWAHVLGDAFSASTFLNMWGQFMAGHVPSRSLHVPKPGVSQFPPSVPKRKPFSLKMVDPVGDYWLTSNNCKMGTNSFLLTARQLNHFISKVCDPSQVDKLSPFEFLSAIIWKSVSKIREDSEPRTVTICTSNSGDRGNEFPSNVMVLSRIEADFSVAKGEISELAELIAEKRVEENGMMEETLEKDDGKTDFIVYGTNLTFVNLEKANIYGLELKGHKPIFVNYTLNGIGEEGVVLVLPGPGPGPENGDNDDGCGRVVTVILPENQVAQLKNELRDEWGLE